ncbi:MAG: glycosyltransferase family 2 protein [Candidatus Bathyarchaeota archaeon]|nr:glycosyltransferase family 2 protein [Candidatus Bathyarchaeum tardum]WGM89264.1 MAG: glycosyltransferase family 2 protein [Candidatus Bathyarchaeum tardum]
MEDKNITLKSVAKIAIVFPALNECEAVGKILDEVKNVMTDYDFDLVVVDGHSTDGTDKIAKKHGAIVLYQPGKGYGDALKTGFLYAKNKLNSEILVMLDADLTYDPKDIPKLVRPIMDGDAELVIGNRFAGMQEGAMPAVNQIGNKAISTLANMSLGIGISDTQSGMRAFKAELLDEVNLMAVGMPFALEMLAKARSVNSRMLELPISYRPRVGETKLSPLKDGFRIFNVIVRLMFDVRPLLFFGTIGTMFGAWGLFLHYVLLPIEIVYIVFPLLLIIGGILAFVVGFAMFVEKGALQKNKTT